MEKKLITAQDIMDQAFRCLKPGFGISTTEIDALKEMFGYLESTEDDVKHT